MSEIRRTYEIKFPKRPSIREILTQLSTAANVINEYTRVEIATNGSTDPDLEEITMTMVTD